MTMNYTICVVCIFMYIHVLCMYFDVFCMFIYICVLSMFMYVYYVYLCIFVYCIHFSFLKHPSWCRISCINSTLFARGDFFLESFSQSQYSKAFR